MAQQSHSFWVDSHAYFILDSFRRRQGPYTYGDMQMGIAARHFNPWTPAALSCSVVPALADFRPLGRLIGLEVFDQTQPSAACSNCRELGIVENWLPDRHFGFILQLSVDAEILFCHQDCILNHTMLCVGEEVIFSKPELARIRARHTGRI